MKLSEMQKNQNKKSSNAKEKSITQAYDELKDCSADELMQKLGKEIQSQKSAGNFDYEMLMASIEKIRPYIQTQTYQNMIRIIENFK